MINFMGFDIGIGGPVIHKNNMKVKKTLQKVGIDHIVLETDSPYLSPEENRGEVNTPLNLKYIIGKIAEELDMAEDDVVKITTKNAKKYLNCPDFKYQGNSTVNLDYTKFFGCFFIDLSGYLKLFGLLELFYCLYNEVSKDSIDLISFSGR